MRSRGSVNSARDDAADAGFGWEDQLAVDANAMVMRPSKFDAALGAALRRGYDTRRAVPLAEKLARADSPFHPAWPGLGRVPDAAQPRREKDWWAKEDIDPHIQRAYGRAEPPTRTARRTNAPRTRASSPETADSSARDDERAIPGGRRVDRPIHPVSHPKPVLCLDSGRGRVVGPPRVGPDGGDGGGGG